MLKYFLKRLFLFFPLFFLISLLIFGLSKATPGNPAERLMQLEGEANPNGGSRSLAFFHQQYERETARMGLNKPAFYFSFLPAAYPDTLHKISLPDQEKTIRKLIAKYGNWKIIEQYFQKIGAFESQLFATTASLGTKFNESKRLTRGLFKHWKKPIILNHFEKLEQEIIKDSTVHLTLKSPLQNLKDSFHRIEKEATPQRMNYPKIIWHGADNQYHNWLKKFVCGDFGVSLTNGQTVSQKINTALFWTLVINSIALFFTFSIALPLGVLAAKKAGSRLDEQISFWSFLLYALPVFWIGTLLLTLFATPDFGLHFVNTGLCALPNSTPFLQQFSCHVRQLFLPVFCLTYPSLAFLIQQMRSSMIAVLQKDFVRTARAKGLTEKQVIWKHGFRNALFPMVTILGNIFPRLIAGSVIVEVIFNLPGMGWLLLESLRAADYPVVYIVLLLGATLTMFGMLIADLVYAFIDPRVRFEK